LGLLFNVLAYLRCVFVTW